MRIALLSSLWLCLLLPLPCPAGDVLRGWGAVVGAPELDDWLASGLVESTSLEVRRERLAVVRWSTALARADGRPGAVLEADWREGRMREMDSEDDSDLATFAGRASLTWELDFFGRIRAAVGAARYAEEVAIEELRAHELAVAAELSRIYVEGRLLQEQVRLRGDILTARRAIADYLGARAAAGLVQAAEVDRAEAALRDSQRRVAEAEEQVALLSARWQYLVPGDAVPRLGAHKGTIGAPPASPPESVLHTYASARPDVRAAEAAWMQRDREAAASKRDRAPKVDAVVSAEGQGPSPLEEPDEWTAWAGIRLSLPVLDSRRSATAARDTARVIAGESLYRDAVSRAILDLQQSYARRIRTEQQLHAAREAADRLAARLRSAEQRQAKGLAALADVERARITWLSAEQEAIILKAATLQAHLDLVRACGGPG